MRMAWESGEMPRNEAGKTSLTYVKLKLGS